MIRVAVLAGKGTDIVEFVYKPMDMDFLWHSFNGLKKPAAYAQTCENPGGSFLDMYEGGWQELLPNINNPTNYKGASLGLHGEACLRVWDYQVLIDTVKEVKIRFSVRLNRAPFFVTKTVTIKSYEPVLEFEESILNEGDEEFKFTWGHHPAFGIPFLSDKCVSIFTLKKG